MSEHDNSSGAILNQDQTSDIDEDCEGVNCDAAGLLSRDTTTMYSVTESDKTASHIDGIDTTIEATAPSTNVEEEIETGIQIAAEDVATKIKLNRKTSRTVFVSSIDESVKRTAGGGNKNNNNSNSVSSTDTTCRESINRQILRITPGAFAIRNPLSSEAAPPFSSSEPHVMQIPWSELRPSLRSVSSQSYSTSTMLQHGSILPVVDTSTIQNQEEEHPTTTKPPPLDVHDSNALSFPAVSVGDDSNIYEGRVITEDENVPEQDINFNDDEKKRTRWIEWCIVASILVLLLAAAVALGIVLTSKQHQNIKNDGFDIILGNRTHNNGNTASGTIPLEHPASTSNNSISSSQHIEKQQIKDHLVSILAPISGDAGVSVFDRSNAATSMDRILALEWLIDDLITMADDDGRIPDWKLIQRYIMALLYFSTDGEGWDLQSYFLSEDDECRWNEATPATWVHTFDEGSSTTILDVVPNITGVTCNEDGKVKGLSMRWNDLSGTLPHELSYLNDSLEEIDFGGGRISGTIPPSWALLTELKGLALNDNCLSGTIPETFSVRSSPSLKQVRPLPSLEIFNAINNPGISGSLNGFCESNIGSDAYREGILAVAGDCGVKVPGDNTDSGGGVKCDCCICCDYNDFQCNDPHTGNSWKSYNLNVHSDWQTSKSFNNNCRTQYSRIWIAEECPCYIQQINDTISNNNVDADDTPTYRGFECTKDCDQEGAEKSYVNFWWG